MYFNAQMARIPGLRATSKGRTSTYPLSQNAGRVTQSPSPRLACLRNEVHYRTSLPHEHMSIFPFRPFGHLLSEL
jgi:hypothetical protein